MNGARYCAKIAKPFLHLTIWGYKSHKLLSGIRDMGPLVDCAWNDFISLVMRKFWMHSILASARIHLPFLSGFNTLSFQGGGQSACV